MLAWPMNSDLLSVIYIPCYILVLHVRHHGHFTMYLQSMNLLHSTKQPMS